MTAPEVPDSPEREVPQEWGRPYGAIVAGTILVVLGVLWLLDATDVLDLSPRLVLPAALAAVGVALVAGAFRGRHPGLITLGVFLSIATLVVALTPVGFSGGIGQRNITVTQQSDLEASYGVALGQVRLDLGGLTVTEPVVVKVGVAAGEIQLIAPPDLPVKIEATVGAGEILLLGERADGLSPRLSYTDPDFDTASESLTLEINVGAGKIEVRR